MKQEILKWRCAEILSNERHGNREISVVYDYVGAIFSNFVWPSPNQVQILMALILFQFVNMSNIRHLQTFLKDIFYKFIPQFVNKMHWLQLQYRVEKKPDESLFLYAFLEKKWRKGSYEKCNVCY